MKAMRHVGVVASDLDKSLRFYKDILGLKLIKDFSEKNDYIDTLLGLKDTDLRMVKLIADDGSMVELLCFASHKRTATPDKEICSIGCSHIAFTVENIASEYERLKGLGIEFISAPCESPDGYARVAFCKDPDGLFIELVEVLNK